VSKEEVKRIDEVDKERAENKQAIGSQGNDAADLAHVPNNNSIIDYRD
jgi:hypothetical protein